jgi:hypothetical protein
MYGLPYVPASLFEGGDRTGGHRLVIILNSFLVFYDWANQMVDSWNFKRLRLSNGIAYFSWASPDIFRIGCNLNDVVNVVAHLLLLIQQKENSHRP